MAGGRGRARDHYRAGRVALWSWLVPGLEKVGSRYGADSSFHKLPDHDEADTYSGPTRPSNLSSNLLPPSTTLAPTRLITPVQVHEVHPPTILVFPNSSHVAGLLEDVSRGQVFPHHQQHLGHFPYTTALSLTVAIGCSLLILNLLVFAAVYYRRDTSRQGNNKMVALGTHEGSNTEGSADVQLRPSGEAVAAKPSSPSQCGTLRSSLATSCDSEAHQEWPPDYSSCCQTNKGSETSTVTRTGARPPHNGTARVVSRPPPPPRSSSYPSHKEPQPLLSPTALLHSNSTVCSEMRV